MEENVFTEDQNKCDFIICHKKKLLTRHSLFCFGVKGNGQLCCDHIIRSKFNTCASVTQGYSLILGTSVARLRFLSSRLLVFNLDLIFQKGQCVIRQSVIYFMHNVN